METSALHSGCTVTVQPIAQTAIASIFLISSSFTCIWGENRVVKGKRASWQLFITIILGAIFLANQAYEWVHLKHEGLWLNFGHHHLGFTMGPVTGRLLAEMLTGEAPFTDPEPYRADRF